MITICEPREGVASASSPGNRTRHTTSPVALNDAAVEGALGVKRLVGIISGGGRAYVQVILGLQVRHARYHHPRQQTDRNTRHMDQGLICRQLPNALSSYATRTGGLMHDGGAQQSEEVAAESPVFAPTRPARSPGDALHRLDEVLHEAVARRVFPGAAVACGSCSYPASSSLQYFSKGMRPLALSKVPGLSNPVPR